MEKLLEVAHRCPRGPQTAAEKPWAGWRWLMLLLLQVTPTVQAAAISTLEKRVPSFNSGVSPDRWENCLKTGVCFGEQGSLTT